MLWEMIVLMYIARKLYKQPVTDLSNTKTKAAMHICTILPCAQAESNNNNNNDNNQIKY